jgi:hypothetical protein
MTSPPRRGAAPQELDRHRPECRNFAEAAVAQARRLSMESAENDNHDGNVYYSGAVYYAT